jgi:membrane-bound lytic murein transglycosylase D
MQKQVTTLILVILLAGINNHQLAAQNNTKLTIERVPLPERNILLSNTLLSTEEDSEAVETSSGKTLDEAEKDIMRRISNTYEIHIQSVQAQIDDDPVSAEQHITAALENVQQLLEEYPEIPGDKQFNELYRTVYTEYKEFYGIEKAENQVNGEVFAVQRELYESDDEWLNGRYVLPENITRPKTEVPLVQNRYVNRHLTYYTIKRPEVMEKWLLRSKKYFPMMKKIFQEEGVPTELVHLSMIESGLNPTARSWASAVGMWQFIRATGSVYGLEVNWWMDERRDPEKATRAAARHLKDLFEIWDDWYLAIANYNISPRGLKRAIRAGGGKKDYWSAYSHLPRETQGYIPGFIATTMINLNAEEFGFRTDYKADAYSYDVALVEPLMPLDELAKAAGISKEVLKEYNPELLRWATPPGDKYPLKLPAGTKNNFLANYKDIPKDKRSRGVAVHAVRKGETLGYIAQKYGTSVRSIYESNERLSSTIYPGQKIVVPLAPGSTQKIAAKSPTNQSGNKRSKTSTRSRSKAPSNSSSVKYTVKKGDTIGHIAEWYDVRASQIRAWNGTSNRLNRKQRLTIYVPKSELSYYKQVNSFSWAKKQKLEREQKSGKNITGISAAQAKEKGPETIQYKVRKNDTLIQIANSFGVSVTQIKKTNNLTGSRIYEGQRLRINKIN